MRRAAAVVALLLAAAVAAGARTLPVEIGELVGYTYKQVFSVKAPTGWRTHDQSQAGRAIIAWIDKTGNGAMRVLVLDQPAPPDARQQERWLRDHLKGQYGRFPQFRVQVGHGQGKLVATWSYLATGTGNTKARLQGRTFLYQRGRRTAVLTLAVPFEQFGGLQERLQKIAASFSLMRGAL